MPRLSAPILFLLIAALIAVVAILLVKYIKAAQARAALHRRGS